MLDPKVQIEAEFESIEEVLSLLPGVAEWPTLSKLELAGVGALLHNFYNGIENVLKVSALARGLSLPAGSSSHRDLVNLSEAQGIVPQTVAGDLREYLAFRHFFSHGYSVELDPRRLEPLAARAQGVYRAFKEAVRRALPRNPR